MLLGDLIDRGPNSYDVIQFVKNSPNMATVKGNHEKMMAQVFSISRLEKPDYVFLHGSTMEVSQLQHLTSMRILIQVATRIRKNSIKRLSETNCGLNNYHRRLC